MRTLNLLSIAIVILTIASCNKDDKSINIFSIEDDKTLGAQMEAEISSRPSEFPILDKTAYASSYTYLEEMKTRILSTGKVYYKDAFIWKLYIIKNDSTLNAFCTPGGYIYIYTGLIKYLNESSHLAGVLGHEMAHADRRHSTDQMTKQYGLSLLFDIVFGNNNQAISDIVAGISALQFSKADETEADEYSVIYLCPTNYKGNGAAGFFQQLIDDGNNCAGAFFSTHPCPDNRVENINLKNIELACIGDGTYAGMTYADFKASLP